MIEKIKKNSIYVFPLVLLVWGIIFSQLLIPWQTPDERNHLWFIGEGVGNMKVYDLLIEDMPMDFERIMFKYDEKISDKRMTEAKHKAPSYSVADVAPHTFKPALIKHLPAAIGLYLGILLRLPTYWALALGELFSLLLYVVICTCIVKMVPKNKALFAAFLMIPMNIQQCTSISYDAVLLPLCYLFIAWLYKIRCERRNLTNKEIIGLILIWALITYVKVPYGTLGLLFFIIPINRYVVTIKDREFKLKNNILTYSIIIAVILIVALLGAYVLRKDVNVAVLIACARNMKQAIKLFVVSMKTWWKYLLVSMIGQFGYLDAPIRAWMMVVSVLGLLVISAIGKNKNPNANHLNTIGWQERLLFLATSVILLVIITLALIRHTYMIMYYGSESMQVAVDYNQMLYQIPYIGGEQGRYYLPGFLTFLLVFVDLIKTNERIEKVLSVLLIVFFIVISYITLKARYF